MGSMNKVILLGYLGKDAEVRYTPGGAAVAKFSMATTEVRTNKAGQRQERTEWHNIELWGKPAESLSGYLVKGKQVCVEGRLQTDKYQGREGGTKYFTKVRADRVVLLGGGSGNGGGRRQEEHEAEPQAVGAGVGHDPDDDIPF